jgi:hypothetical protein
MTQPTIQELEKMLLDISSMVSLPNGTLGILPSKLLVSPSAYELAMREGDRLPQYAFDVEVNFGDQNCDTDK